MIRSLNEYGVLGHQFRSLSKGRSPVLLEFLVFMSGHQVFCHQPVQLFSDEAGLFCEGKRRACALVTRLRSGRGPTVGASWLVSRRVCPGAVNFLAAFAPI